MALDATHNEEEKLCFVTTGATAPFIALIESILRPSSLESLLQNGITHVLVQYGTAKDVFEESAAIARAYLEKNGKQLIIDGMDFDPNGLVTQFISVQRTRGLVISHAGKWLGGQQHICSTAKHDQGLVPYWQL